MSRSTKLICTLTFTATFLGLTTLVLAGPTPTPAIPPTQCTLDNPTAVIVTNGRQHSDSKTNKIIVHEITGNILNLKSYNVRSHSIQVCEGSKVTTVVTDNMSGNVINTVVSGDLNCDATGCSGIIDVRSKYTTSSDATADTDSITLVPRPF